MILFSTKTKRSRKSAANMFAAIAQNNEHYSRDLIVILEKELHEKDDI